jgi:hypothetical protein
MTTPDFKLAHLTNVGNPDSGLNAMWIRSAFWVGAPKAGAEAGWQQLVNDVLLPGLNALPGVKHARAMWPRKLEDSPPAIACQVLVEFACRGDMDRMLASDERKAMRPCVLEAMGLFDGGLSHIDFETAGH